MCFVFLVLLNRDKKWNSAVFIERQTHQTRNVPCGKPVYRPDARWRFCDQKYKLPKFWIFHIKIVPRVLFLLLSIWLFLCIMLKHSTTFGEKTVQNGGVVVEPEALQWPKFKQ